MEKNYPKYISTLPSGEDKLKGNSHEKIALAICNIIKNKTSDIKKQIIGLEGEWGSGKSNIIKIIQRDQDLFLPKEEYLHFTYDSWGHQEDLNRRALLEELIEYLDSKEVITNKSSWEEKKKTLSGKTITSTKQNFPEIKTFWIFFILGFISYQGLLAFYKVFKDADIFPNFYFGVFKQLIAVWFIPLILYGFGLRYLIKGIRKDVAEKKKKLPEILKQTFYLLNGKEIESKTSDHIIENEPSNKEFRGFLTHINAELDLKEIKLVLIIDNIDRLSEDKVQSLWSIINIFFAENTEGQFYGSIWLIIPFDEGKIIKCFDNDHNDGVGRGLIDKTFAVKFRVTPPIYSNWEDLLDKYFVHAFGQEFIKSNSDEIYYCKKIFDNYITTGIIKPRQIINYINDIVTLNLQYPKLRLRYLALFVMNKESFLKDPVNLILSRLYINGNTKFFFREDEDLDKNMAAIVFGVSLEDSEEVLLSRDIKMMLSEGKVDEVEKFRQTTSFPMFFGTVFNELEFTTLSAENLAVIPVILIQIEQYQMISSEMIKKYWNHLTIEIGSMDWLNENLNEVHKLIAINNERNGLRVLNKCIQIMFGQINSEESERIYIDRLSKIIKFVRDSKLGFSLEKLLIPNRKITPKSYLHLMDKDVNSFEAYNLSCSESNLTSYFKPEDIVETKLLDSELEKLIILRKKYSYKFVKLIDVIKSQVRDTNDDTIGDLVENFELLKELSDEDQISNISVSMEVISANINPSESDEKLFVLLLMLSLLSDNKNSIQNYSKVYNELIDVENLSLTKAIYKDLDRVISFQTLLNTILKNPEMIVVKDVAKQMILGSKTGRLNILSVLQNYEKICLLVLENKTNECLIFYKKISKWAISLSQHLDKNLGDIKTINLKVFDMALNKDTNLSKVLISKSIEFLSSVTRDSIFQIFSNLDSDFFDNQLLLKLFYNPNPTTENFVQLKMEILKKFLNDFAIGNNKIPLKDFKPLSIILHKNLIKDKDSFLNIIANNLNTNPALTPHQISFFAEDLLKEKVLLKNPDKSIPNLFCYLIDDDVLYGKYFKKHYQQYITIVSRSRKNKIMGINLLKRRLKHYSIKHEIRIYADRKLPGWNIDLKKT